MNRVYRSCLPSSSKSTTKSKNSVETVNSDSAERNPWASSERMSVVYTLPVGFEYLNQKEFTLAYVVISKVFVLDSLSEVFVSED